MTDIDAASPMNPQESAEAIGGAAAAWHAGIDRADFDWDAFTLWLEADESHRRAYDEVAMIDAMVGERAAALIEHHVWTEEAIVSPRRSARWWLAGGGGVVAAGIATLMLWPASPPATESMHATGSAAATIALADGAMVVLAPYSRLEVAADGHRLRLSGEALFNVRHRPDRTISVSAGGLTIIDIGTRFDIATGTRGTRIAVAAGEVAVAAPGLSAMVPLKRGHQLTYDRAHDSATVMPLAPAGIAAWQQGHLTYEDAPLSLVADDLARYSQRPVIVAPGLGQRRFSGTLALGGSVGRARGEAAGSNADGAQRALEDLAGLMGLGLVHAPHAFLLVDRGGAAPRR